MPLAVLQSAIGWQMARLDEGEAVSGVLVGYIFHKTGKYVAIEEPGAGDGILLPAHAGLCELLDAHNVGEEITIRCVHRERPKYHYELMVME
jgi:hypothetical protein